jgi:hypothetical protein
MTVSSGSRGTSWLGLLRIGVMRSFYHGKPGPPVSSSLCDRGALFISCDAGLCGFSPVCSTGFSGAQSCAAMVCSSCKASRPALSLNVDPPLRTPSWTKVRGGVEHFQFCAFLGIPIIAQSDEVGAVFRQLLAFRSHGNAHHIVYYLSYASNE